MKDKILTIRITTELKKELEASAKKLNISMSSLITMALIEKIRKEQ